MRKAQQPTPALEPPQPEPPQPKPTNTNKYGNNTTIQTLHQSQKIPNPVPPLISIGHKHKPISAPPYPLPDYEYYNDLQDEVDDGDVIVYDSDNELSNNNEHSHPSDEHSKSENSRNERLRRVHTYALRYLAGDRVYIHCARLRGPVVNNPWKKKKRGKGGGEEGESEGVGQDTEVQGQLRIKKRKEGGSGNMEVEDEGKRGGERGGVKRRRLMREEQNEVMATPAQKSRRAEVGMGEDAGGGAGKRGPKRKRGVKKKVILEDDDEEEEEDEEEKGEEGGEEGGASEQEKDRKRTTTGKGSKKNPPQKPKPKNQKPKPSTTGNKTSKNTGKGKASTTTRAPKNPAATGLRRRKAGFIQEEATVEEKEKETTTLKKPIRRKGGRGQKAKAQAPAVESSGGEEEEADMEESIVLSSNKNREDFDPILNSTTQKGSEAIVQTPKNRVRGTSEPQIAAAVGEKATESTGGNTSKAATRKTIQQRHTTASTTPMEQSANSSPNFPITPVAELSLEDPTPPSVFYGSGSSTLREISAGTNLADKLFAVRREVSEPVAKSKAPAGKRAGSVPLKATSSRVTGAESKVAAENGVGKRKRKQTAVIVEEGGGGRRCRSS